MPPHNTDDVRIRELKELTPPAHSDPRIRLRRSRVSDLIYSSPPPCTASCTVWTTA